MPNVTIGVGDSAFCRSQGCAFVEERKTARKKG